MAAVQTPPLSLPLSLVRLLLQCWAATEWTSALTAPRSPKHSATQAVTNPKLAAHPAPLAVQSGRRLTVVALGASAVAVHPLAAPSAPALAEGSPRSSAPAWCAPLAKDHLTWPGAWASLRTSRLAIAQLAVALALSTTGQKSLTTVMIFAVTIGQLLAVACCARLSHVSSALVALVPAVLDLVVPDLGVLSLASPSPASP